MGFKNPGLQFTIYKKLHIRSKILKKSKTTTLPDTLALSVRGCLSTGGEGYPSNHFFTSAPRTQRKHNEFPNDTVDGQKIFPH